MGLLSADLSLMFREGVSRTLIYLDTVPSTQWGRSFGGIRLASWSWRLEPNVTTVTTSGGRPAVSHPRPVPPSTLAMGSLLWEGPAPALAAT